MNNAKPNPLPPADYLRRRFRLDRKTGILYWKRRPALDFSRECDALTWNKRWAGNVAGSPHTAGYRTVIVNGQKFYEHRVVYCIVHGIDPGAFRVDHVDNGRSNVPRNLQLLTNARNVQKRKELNTNNTSGVTGVSAHANGWSAYITVNRVRQHLGWYKEIKAAIAARRAAERLHFKQT